MSSSFADQVDGANPPMPLAVFVRHWFGMLPFEWEGGVGRVVMSPVAVQAELITTWVHGHYDALEVRCWSVGDPGHEQVRWFRFNGFWDTRSDRAELPRRADYTQAFFVWDGGRVPTSSSWYIAVPT